MTIRVTLDSNILLYATLEPQTAKGQRAADIVLRSASCGVLTTQALAEFVAVVRKRAPNLLQQAFVQADAWADTFAVVSTEPATLLDAEPLVVAHGLQVWDAVIWTAAKSVGASYFLSEDLQDGLSLEGMTVINPLKDGNEDAVRAALGEQP